MDKNLSKLMKLAYNHPETGLSSDIWCSIQRRQEKRLKMQSLVYGMTGVLSLGGFVFMSISLVKEFVSSGFFQYVSVAFSGGGTFAAYWKEYLLTLADSIPMASLVASLFLLVSVLVSVRKVVHQFKNKLLVSN